MKNFGDAALESEVIDVMMAALDHAVASLRSRSARRMSNGWQCPSTALQTSAREAQRSSSELPLWNCGSCRGIDAVRSPGFSEQIVACRRSSCMIETMQQVLENSFRIAWEYLEATGELGEPNDAARFLLDNISVMMGRGESRKLLLSNRAIDAYRRSCAKRSLALVS
jgi:hypothetical protein